MTQVEQLNPATTEQVERLNRARGNKRAKKERRSQRREARKTRKKIERIQAKDGRGHDKINSMSTMHDSTERDTRDIIGNRQMCIARYKTRQISI